MKALPFLIRKLLDASFIRLKVLRRIFVNIVKGFQPFKKEGKNFGAPVQGCLKDCKQRENKLSAWIVT